MKNRNTQKIDSIINGIICWAIAVWIAFILISCLTSCSKDDAPELFCGTIVAVGNVKGQDGILRSCITIDNVQKGMKQFPVENLNNYHKGEFACK